MPTDKSNLAWQAAQALAGFVGRANAGLEIQIRKRIPVAAGLAGGSADAAATLVACNELWQAGLSQRELAEIGAGLGSDVPFALMGGTAVGRGRGEQLTPALAAGTYHRALAFGLTGLSTANVYATCDRLRAARSAAGGARAPVPRPELSHPLMTALRSGDPAERLVRCWPTTCSRTRCAVPANRNCAAPSQPGVSTTRSVRSCRVQGRRAPSWPGTRGMRGSLRSPSLARVSAGRWPGRAGLRRAPLWSGISSNGEPGQPRTRGQGAYHERVRCSTRSRSGCQPGSGSVWSAATARARARCWPRWPGRRTWTPAGSPGQETSPSGTCRRPSHCRGLSARSCSAASPNTGGRAIRAGGRGSRACSAAWTAGPGSVRCPAANDAGRRSRPCCAAATTCCCWTSRPTTWTSRRSAGWPATCASTRPAT